MACRTQHSLPAAPPLPSLPFVLCCAVSPSTFRHPPGVCCAVLCSGGAWCVVRVLERVSDVHLFVRQTMDEDTQTQTCTEHASPPPLLPRCLAVPLCACVCLFVFVYVYAAEGSHWSCVLADTCGHVCTLTCAESRRCSAMVRHPAVVSVSVFVPVCLCARVRVAACGGTMTKANETFNSNI